MVFITKFPFVLESPALKWMQISSHIESIIHNNLHEFSIKRGNVWKLFFEHNLFVFFFVSKPYSTITHLAGVAQCLIHHPTPSLNNRVSMTNWSIDFMTDLSAIFVSRGLLNTSGFWTSSLVLESLESQIGSSLWGSEKDT